MIARGDRQVLHATWVTLYCTIGAVWAAAMVAVPYGAWLALYRPRGYRLQVFLLRLGMFTPTVVVGLVLWGLFSREGPLSSLDALYTKQAIVAGEFLLAFPILGTMTHAVVCSQRGTPLETALTLGAGRARALLTMLGEVRVGVAAALLMGLARCYSELGVAINVGGNLEMRTRTLASGIVLDLAKGLFARAMAAGILLMALAAVFAASAFYLLEREDRA
jgi:tungstate transport system permease protein